MAGAKWRRPSGCESSGVASLAPAFRTSSGEQCEHSRVESRKRCSTPLLSGDPPRGAVGPNLTGVRHHRTRHTHTASPAFAAGGRSPSAAPAV